MKLTLQLTKSTKGTHVYADASEDAPVPTLYIKREKLPKNPPSTITVEITHE